MMTLSIAILEPISAPSPIESVIPEFYNLEYDKGKFSLRKNRKYYYKGNTNITPFYHQKILGNKNNGSKNYKKIK